MLKGSDLAGLSLEPDSPGDIEYDSADCERIQHTILPPEDGVRKSHQEIRIYANIF